MSSPAPHPVFRKPTLADFTGSLGTAARDMRRAPLASLALACVFVLTGLAMAWVTLATGHTFWLILAVMGFPLVGSLAVVGFYEIARRVDRGEAAPLADVLRVVIAQRHGQLPWLAAIIVVVFLFWFFLGHMIFALFLGLAPMTNVTSSIAVFWTADGLSMLAFGSAVGAIFAALVFGITVLGIPMILDREVDFVTAMLRSLSAVLSAPLVWLGWGAFIAVVTLVSILPGFLGLFLTMPVLGYASWHLYQRVSTAP